MSTYDSWSTLDSQSWAPHDCVQAATGSAGVYSGIRLAYHWYDDTMALLDRPAASGDCPGNVGRWLTGYIAYQLEAPANNANRLRGQLSNEEWRS